MKKTLIVALIILYGCSNSKNEKSMEYSDIEEISIESSDNYAPEKPNFSEFNIIEEKLQDLYDISFYVSKHPEFENDVLKDNSGLIENLDEAAIISNLKPLTPIEAINDSIKSVVIEYAIKSGQLKRIDTVKAILSSKKIIIENEEISSLDIRFSKLEN